MWGRTKAVGEDKAGNAEKGGVTRALRPSELSVSGGPGEEKGAERGLARKNSPKTPGVASSSGRCSRTFTSPHEARHTGDKVKSSQLRVA